MNLLRDPWIPVRKGSDFKQITYKELLCSEQSDLQVALPRDDLELACIQMLAALTQVIFMPVDKKGLRARIKTPLTEQEYDAGIKKHLEWFDLEHPQWPFMQVLDPGASESTLIQKLFPGLPAGVSHAFFNEVNECRKVCPSCAVISLFNLCTHTPNMSGKHKGGLRGNAPISTMVYDGSLRRMIWKNVLSKDIVDQIFVGSRTEQPVWVEPIEEKRKISATSIGMIRGLFWTPVLVRLQSKQEMISCDCCGLPFSVAIEDFVLGSDFKFEIQGLWPHPYSPRQLNLQKENKKSKEKPEESVVSFRTTAPAWTQFSELLFQSEKTDKKEGYIPAAVVRQYNDLFSDQPLHLIVGGYRNKQAAILQRRHELYSVPAGWNEDLRDKIVEVVNIGLDCRKLLVDKTLYPVVKGNKDNGIKGVGGSINSKASELYFHLTEHFIHRMLRDTSLKEFAQVKTVFIDELCQICFDIFEQVTRPYTHKPELVGTVALARVKLKRLLRNLKEQHTSGGAV